MPRTAGPPPEAGSSAEPDGAGPLVAPISHRAVAPPHDGLGALVVAVGAALVAWFRLTPVTRATVWAEDGREFLMAALHSPPFATLLRPYDGYLHLVPRTASELIALMVPPERYALALTAVSCLVAGAVAGTVFVCARSVTDVAWLRVALAAVTVVVPSLPLEVLGNLANVHWFLLWLTPWLLVYVPHSRAGSLAAGAAALVCALTEIQVVYFLPLMAWRWRERRGWPVRIGLLLGLVGQLAAVLTTTRSSTGADAPMAGDVAAGYLVNAPLALWIGSTRSITNAVAAFGWGVGLAVLVPSALALALALWRGTSAQRLVAVALPLASVVAWSAAFVVNRPPGILYRSMPDTGVELPLLRYSPVPAMFLLAALLVGFAAVSWRQGPARFVATALAIPLVLVLVLNFAPADATRADGPVWAHEVDRGVQACRAAPREPDVPLAVAPGGAWVAQVPCHVLTPP